MQWAENSRQSSRMRDDRIRSLVGALFVMGGTVDGEKWLHAASCTLGG